MKHTYYMETQDWTAAGTYYDENEGDGIISVYQSADGVYLTMKNA